MLNVKIAVYLLCFYFDLICLLLSLSVFFFPTCRFTSFFNYSRRFICINSVSFFFCKIIVLLAFLELRRPKHKRLSFFQGCIFCRNFEIIPPPLESLPQIFDENFPKKLKMFPSLWFLFHFLLFSSLLWLFCPFAFSFSSLFQSYFTFSLL